jgi:2-C-methyl-D-erythritol 4-phosphate cytidylyltransferase
MCQGEHQQEIKDTLELGNDNNSKDFTKRWAGLWKVQYPRAGNSEKLSQAQVLKGQGRRVATKTHRGQVYGDSHLREAMALGRGVEASTETP